MTQNGVPGTEILMQTTSHLHRDLGRGFDGIRKFWKVFTENDVTLGSGGAGWATGYQDYPKAYLHVGVARNTQNNIPATLEVSLRSPLVFFLLILSF